MDPYGDEYAEDEVTRQIVAQLVELERIASSLRMIDLRSWPLGMQLMLCESRGPSIPRTSMS